MKYLLLGLLWVTPIAAQSLPDKPIPTVKTDLIDESTNRHVVMSLRVPHSTTDRAWWIWTVTSIGATIADVEITQHLCLSNPQCREGNPIYGGSRPKRITQYAIAGGITSAATWYSWHRKRKDDAERAWGLDVKGVDHWWVIQLVNTLNHGVSSTITIIGRPQ